MKLAACVIVIAAACGSQDSPPATTSPPVAPTPATPATPATPPATTPPTTTPPATTPPTTMPTNTAAKPANTRAEAYAIALAAVQAQHPGTVFTLRDETTGGGINGPWVFLIAPASTKPGDQIPGLGPMLVSYGGTTAIALRPHPNGIKAAVNEWEIATYGHLQR